MVISKKRFGYLLGHLSFWVSGVESPFIFYTKKNKNKNKIKIKIKLYMVELFHFIV